MALTATSWAWSAANTALSSVTQIFIILSSVSDMNMGKNVERGTLLKVNVKIN